ncbi:MAG: trypsin-like peptidase domain-containing protein, partial [Actinobacteria bacterium]|nr:trypsin-like peptidase domain-containing protein [Actinomycetota bacterium]
MKRNLLKILLIFLVMALVLGFTSMVYAQDEATKESVEYEFSPGDAYLLVQPAVCYITSIYFAYVYDTERAAWSEQYYYGPFGGTGFVVNPETGTIVTAGHMVDDIVANYVALKWAILDAYIFNEYPDDYYNLTDADWNWIYDNFKVEGTNKTEPDREVWVQFNTATANVPDNPGNTYTRAEVVNLSDRDQRDIAIIKIAPVTGRALSSAIIGDSSMIDIGSEVTIIGYPWTSDIGQNNALNPTVTQGSISGRVMYRGTDVLQVQGDARPGNSGGPVISKSNGTIIGILTMGTDNTNLYLRPANDIKALLGTENKLGQVDAEWRTGLAMYKQNHFSEALKHFDAVLNLSAGHLLAQEYKAKAQANMGSDVPLTVATETVEETTAATIAVETLATESIKVEPVREAGKVPSWVF